MRLTRLTKTAAVLCLAVILAAPVSAQVEDWKDIAFPQLREHRIQQPSKITLPNGMILFLQEDKELPLVRGTIVVRGGGRDVPADKTGLADIYGEVWRTGGTKTKTGDQLDDELELIAAKVETGGDGDSTSISWDSLKGDFDRTFAVVMDLLRNPEFREDKIALAKNQLNTVIARRNDDVMEIANREATRLGYGPESPWGRIPEYDTVAAVTRDDLVKWHQTYVHPNNMIVGVIGDFDAKAMEKKLRAAFGPLKKGPAAMKPAYATSPAKPGVYHVAKDDVTQSQIRMLHTGIRRDDPDYYAVQVMNEVFGGGFAARLFSNIRTKKGLAYMVGGGVGSAYDHKGLFNLRMGTKNETVGAAIDALYEEIDRLQNEPITAEEVEKAKDSIRNSFIFQYDSKDKILNQRLLLEYYGYPADFLTKYREGIDKITAAEVEAAAKKHIRKGEIAVLVVGRSADFDVALDKYGTVTTLDIAIPDPGASTAGPVVAGAEGKALAKKVLAAYGSTDALLAVKSYKQVVTLNLKTPQGEMAIEQEELAVLPDKVRQTMKTPMGQMSMVATPDGAFMASPMGSRDLPSSQKDDLIGGVKESPFYLAANLDSESIEFAIAGTERIGEVEATILQITGDGLKAKWFVDPATGRVLRTSKTGPQGIQVIDHTEFREIGGITFPVKGTLSVGGQDAGSFEVLSFEANPAVDAAAFDKPAA
jgi:zinc protease